MIILTVTEITYEKGTNCDELYCDIDNCLVASVDPDDEEIPMKPKTYKMFDPQSEENYFTKDFTVRLYDVNSTGRTKEEIRQDAENGCRGKDEAVLESLQLEFLDDDLRCWFEDAEVGENILETAFSGYGEDCELEFVSLTKFDKPDDNCIEARKG